VFFLGFVWEWSLRVFEYHGLCMRRVGGRGDKSDEGIFYRTRNI
jgi:hypothetical protein